MSNINSRSSTKKMFSICNNALNDFSMMWQNFIANSQDNTKSMVRNDESLLKKIKGVDEGLNTFWFGCPWHLAHVCVGKSGKELSINVHGFIVDLYYHFGRSTKRKTRLQELMELLNNNE